MRDTTSTLLPPVALPGELATLGRVAKIREAGQSNNSPLVDPPGRAIPGSPSLTGRKVAVGRRPSQAVRVRAGVGHAARFREERPVCGRCGDAAPR